MRAVIITLCSASVRPERKSWRTWGATSAVITLTRNRGAAGASVVRVAASAGDAGERFEHDPVGEEGRDLGMVVGWCQFHQVYAKHRQLIGDPPH